MSRRTSHPLRWLAALGAGAALVTAVALASTRDRDPAPSVTTSEPADAPVAAQPTPPTAAERLGTPPAEQPAAPPTAPPAELPAAPPTTPVEQPATSAAEQPTSTTPEPAPATLSPAPGPSGPARSTSSPARRPLPPFDESAARALLRANAARVRACKAESTFRGVETTVRLTGTVAVAPRGRATLTMPPGYDITPCLERLVAALKFQPSDTGGSFEYTFLL